MGSREFFPSFFKMVDINSISYADGTHPAEIMLMILGRDGGEMLEANLQNYQKY